MGNRSPRVTPATALVPLRVFLGITFVYAGYQKLSDPGFFHPGAPTYIGTQLHAFSTGTPLGFLLRWFALPFPTLAGAGVAMVEIAVGLLVTAGLFTRVAAAAGMSLNLVLFLTATWNTTPYFLGSDIVFVFAWLPFVLAGAQGQPALDHRLRRPTSTRRATGAMHVYGGPAVATSSRHELLQRALLAVGGGTLAVAGFATLIKGGYRSPESGLASTTHLKVHHRHASQAATGASDSASTGSATAIPTGAVKVGTASGLAVGQAATYKDPADGSTDIVIRQSGGGLTAMSAICTHAGCEVGYQGGILYCPCHGSQFDATTGAVIQGPAVTALPRKRVIERAGEIYAVP